MVLVDLGWVKMDMGGENVIYEFSESVGNMFKILYGLKELNNGEYFYYFGRNVFW